jgi:putative lipoic acid-binding regulatory protein
VTKDYAELKRLLEDLETFPHRFTFKFIGRHSETFALSVAKLEQRFPGLRHEQSRESNGGKHVAKTYTMEATSADEIIDVFKAIEKVEDVLVVL